MEEVLNVRRESQKFWIVAQLERFVRRVER
jgi:hypothetical protein